MSAPMNQRLLLSSLFLAFLPLNLSAQDVQVRAQGLLEHARQLSDIRSAASPGFRLKANFSFVGDDLDTEQGTYTETWVSDSQWRHELVVNDVHRIEIGAPSSSWLFDSKNDFPETAGSVAQLMQVVLASDKDLRFGTLVDHPDTKPPSACIITKPDSQKLKSAFCFDAKVGLLLERVSPERRWRQARLRNISDYSCDFADFRKFGEHLFPWQITCFVDEHKKISATVVELSLTPSANPELFTPPQGAIELGKCPDTAVPPRWVGAGLGISSHNDPDHTSWVSVWFVVDVKGRPQGGRVIHTPDRTRDDKVLKKIQEWFFQPGTCNGAPMPMPIMVEMPFPS